MHQPSTAPSGAHCAVHAERAASLVCGRCGNFMCAECSEGGAQAQCPSCRALTGGDAFPYRRDDFDFNRLWAHAWSSFQREWLMLTVGALVLMGLILGASLVASLINSVLLRIVGVTAEAGDRGSMLRFMGVSFVSGQVIGTLVSMVVQGVAMTGYYRLVMDALLGRRADLGRMFGQLRKLPTYVGTQLLLYVAVTVPTLVYFGGLGLAALAAIGVDWRNFDDLGPATFFHPTMLLVMGAGMALYLVLVVVVLLPLTLFVVPEIVVSDAGVFEAIGRSWRMSSGLRWPMLGYSLVVGLLVMLGAVLCFVPVLPALALGMCLLLSLFLAARNGLGLPPADHA